MPYKLIIIVLIVIIVSILAYYLIISSNIKKRTEKYKKLVKSINKREEQIRDELSRTKKISKNEKSIKLFDEWLEEYEHYKKTFDIINQLKRRLVKNARFMNRKDFNDYARELDTHLEGFQDQLDVLYNKIKQYTSYELENTKISLDLKKQTKELENTFDTKLRYLEIYNRSFEERIAEIETGITSFEDLQRSGEYPKAREILKDCSSRIDSIDYVLVLISKLQEYLSVLNAKIESIENHSTQMKTLNFSINLIDFDATLNKFKMQSNEMLNQVTYIDFSRQVDRDELKQLELNLKTLDSEITEYNSIVQEKTSYIREIIDYIDENQALIDEGEKTVKGAIEQQENIMQMYVIHDIQSTVNELTEEIETFNHFIEDYNELIAIIYAGKEDYARLRSRIIKANKYIKHYLANMGDLLRKFYTIQNDELEARENLNKYKRNYVEIDLFIRRTNHKEHLSQDIKNIIHDIEIKLDLLENALNTQPINISDVRNLSVSVEKLTAELIKKEALTNNIKQREAAKLIIFYFNRFTETHDGLTYSNRFNSLYGECEYKRILKEAYELLIEANNDGKKIYEQIVKPAMNIPVFEPVLNTRNQDIDIA